MASTGIRRLRELDLGQASFAGAFCLLLVLRGGQGAFERAGVEWTGLLGDIVVLFCALAAPMIGGKCRWTIAGRLFVVYVLCVGLMAIPSAAVSSGMAGLGLRSMVMGPLCAFVLERAQLEAGFRKLVGFIALLVVSANCVVGLAQTLRGYSAEMMDHIASQGSTYLVEGEFRLVGLQSSGQDFSLIVGASAAWAIWFVSTCVDRTRLAWVIAIVFLPLTVLSTILAFQRSALIGLGFATAFLLIAALVKGVRGWTVSRGTGAALGRWSALSLAVCILSVSFLASDKWSHALARVQTLFSLGSDNSWSIRSGETIPVALRLVAENPLGYGTGASGSVAARFPSSPLFGYTYGGLWADNGYLFVALQLGLAGLLIWLIFLLSWVSVGALVLGGEADVEHFPFGISAVVLFLLGAMVSGSFWGLGGTVSIPLMLAVSRAGR